MKNFKVQPQSQTYWYINKLGSTPQLRQSKKADIVIIGGGMAGLTAAQSFQEKGRSVILLEQFFCGAGATGKSSGFITPDSELELNHFITLFGVEQAKKIWQFALDGCGLIQKNIKQFALQCDYQEQDTLIVANNKSAIAHIQKECTARADAGYPSTFYTQETLPQIMSGDYYAGIRYQGSFGIQAYHYCQQMKNVLQERGVQIYEETPVLSLQSNSIQTRYGTIEAEKIVVCADRFMPELGLFTDTIYQAQTVLMISAPLTDQQVQQLFPEKRLMVWDTDLIYTYYRLTGDNRLLLGGSDILATYVNKADYNATRIVHKLMRYWRKKFPDINITFDYYWPGLIGISKDFMPIAGYASTLPSVYGIGAAAGLPWAAALGNYSAQHIIEQRTDMDIYFNPNRSFFINAGMQKVLGKRISFALSNAKTIWF